MSFPPYPKYKPSGVEWLGDVPEHWDSGSVRWLSQRYSGGTPDKTKLTYWSNGTIPWLNSGAVNDRLVTTPSTYITDKAFQNSSAKWIPKGALVMALAGQGKTKGMVAQVGIRTTCNQSMAAILPGNKITSRFLFWWLDSNYANIRNLAGGDLRDGLNLELLGSIRCPLPPLAEQTQIAAFLDRETGKIDELVAKQRRLIELLKEKRRAVISHAVTRGLNPDAPTKPSGIQWLGNIPEHWEVKKVKHLASRISSGKTPLGGSEVYVDQGVTFLRSQNVYDEGLRLDEVVYISEEVDVAMAVSRVKPNDILLNITGASIGRSCVVPENIGSANVNQHVCVIRLRTSSPVQFVSWLFKATTTKLQIDHAQNGAAREGLNFVQIGLLDIVLPTHTEQLEIVAHLDAETAKLDALTAEAERAIELLQERRTALISSAVTGKIDVRDVGDVTA